MIIDLLNKLNNSGDLHTLYKNKLISPCVLQYRKVFISYQLKIDVGLKVSQAVFETSLEFKITERSIYSIIKIMNTETL